MRFPAKRLTLLLASWATLIAAQPLQVSFDSCADGYTQASARLNVTEVFAAIVPGDEAQQLGLAGDGQDVLRLNLFGQATDTIQGYSNDTNKLATLLVDSAIGGINIYDSASWLCASLYPSELTPISVNDTYCPFAAGDFGLNISIPLYRPTALTTLGTEIRVIDTTAEANTVACIQLQVTPYDKRGWYYGIFLWLPVALAVGLWLVSWSARFMAGWVIGSGVAEYGAKGEGVAKQRLDKRGRRDAKMRKWGTMIVSGISGERLSVSSALLRFATPGLRDILHHLQFCTILGMIAVQWPTFAYPIMARGAWADLVWNNTVIAVPQQVTPSPSSPPSNFQAQVNNISVPLYMQNTKNPLLDLRGTADGMPSFAQAVGIRQQDLFGTCLVLFLFITAAIFMISIIFWVAHALTEAFSERPAPITPRAVKRQSYGSTTASLGPEKYEMAALPSAAPQTRGPSKLRRAWWRFRPRGEAGAFHAAALYGNLLRIILIFHLPITVFSIRQLTLSEASIVSRVFAGLAFVFISLAIPAGVLYKMHRTPSGKLYDATRTLLAMGTMYNHYVMDKQMFRVAPLAASLITGVVVGAGQASGIAQAVVLVVVELVMLIIPAISYPWGEGASMGSVSAILGIVRVCCTLLVMLMAAELSMTSTIRDWLAYAVFILIALSFLFFLFMLFTKIIEGIIRLSGRVHFDESTHPLDGGILGAIADLDCLNGVTGGKAAARRRRKRGSRQLQRNVSAAGSLTTQQMLDRHSHGVRLSTDVNPDGSLMFPPAAPNMSDGYFPFQPPLGPPPMERHSSDSQEVLETNGGAIMDAWNPYSPPPQRGFSVVGRADQGTPYTVQRQQPERAISPVSDRSKSPASIHSPGSYGPITPASMRPGARPVNYRNPSSAELLGSYGYTPRSTGQPSTPMYPFEAPTSPGSSHNPLHPVEHVPLRPPMMPITKRRSLNDLKDSSASDRSDSPSPRKDRTRVKRSGGRRWFSSTRNDEDSDDSDDPEPFPMRSPAGEAKRASLSGRGKGKQAEVPFAGDMQAFKDSPLGRAAGAEAEMAEPQSKGWRNVLSLGRRRKDDSDEAERLKDENRARKAALANESGALFAGVESPSKPSRKRMSFPGVAAAESNAGPSSGTFTVNRKSASPLPATSSPATYPPTAPSPAGEGERTFKVKRAGHAVPRPQTATAASDIELGGGIQSTQASPYFTNTPLGRSEQGHGYPPSGSSRQASASGHGHAAATPSPKPSYLVMTASQPMQPSTSVGRSSDGEQARSFKVVRANRQPDSVDAHTRAQAAAGTSRSEGGHATSPVRSTFVVRRPQSYRQPSDAGSTPVSSGENTPTRAFGTEVSRAPPGPSLLLGRPVSGQGQLPPGAEPPAR